MADPIEAARAATSLLDSLDVNGQRFRSQITEMLRNGYFYINLEIGEWKMNITCPKEEIQKAQSFMIAAIEKGLEYAKKMESEDEEYRSNGGPQPGYG
mgnify:FL=1